MTDSEYTHLVFVVDRSGSMAFIAADAEGGIKSLIAEQRAQPGKLTVSMWEFDGHVREVIDIDDWHLEPRGTTALLDAIGIAVRTTGNRLRALPEDARPGRVVVVITTDGMENSSREFTNLLVNAMITEQQEKYAWEFVFTAANQDAFATARALNIRHAMNFDPAGPSVLASYGAVGQTITAYRSGASAVESLGLLPRKA